jgi:uncharacterized UBP type Zn finger protein
VDRLFGFLQEERRQCKRCRGEVCAEYTRQFVWTVRPKLLEGGPMTLAEMYLDSCGPDSVTKRCEVCGENTEHAKQSRVFTAPNVLVVQVQRKSRGCSVRGARVRA